MQIWSSEIKEFLIIEPVQEKEIIPELKTQIEKSGIVQRKDLSIFSRSESES